MNENNVLKFDPCVFMVERDYQIIFLTETMGIGWIEIDGERFTDEEGGILKYSKVHKIEVDGNKLNASRRYTVVFVEYNEKPSYWPKGVEKVRKEYSFKPLEGDKFRLVQFADTHNRIDSPLELYRSVGECDLIVLNGDINNSSKNIDMFATSFAIGGTASRGEIPMIHSRGNHDTRGADAQYLLDYIPTVTRKNKRETFYTVRQGSVWCLVLDCGEDKWDISEEYGGTVQFDTFRERETKFIESVIQNKENEYEAPGVKYRFVFSHIPFNRCYRPPFDVARDIYDYWLELIGKMNIDLMLCGHQHASYFVPANTELIISPKKIHRVSSFPVAICSNPETVREDGSKYYSGALIEVDGEKRTVWGIPENISMDF